MPDDNLLTTVSNGTSIVKMIIEPRSIKKINSAINQSMEESKKIVDSNIEPSCICTNNYFVCNKSYLKLLQMYNCPQNHLGMHQLNNIQKVIVNADIDESKINEDTINFDIFMKIVDEIRYVSDEVLSKAWSKLLKKELENDQRYSMRTISLLSQLSSEEASLFYKNGKYIFKDYGGIFYYINESNIKGIELIERTTLIEIGFIGSENLSITNGELIWNGHYIKTNGSIDVFKLTTFGVDIYQLMDIDFTINDCKQILDTQKKITSYSIYEMIDDSQYISTPLYSKEQEEGDN